MSDNGRNESVHLSVEQVYQLALQAMLNNGFSREHAEVVAENVTAGERDGCASHDLYRILGCVNSLKAGKVAADTQPVITEPTSA